MTPGFSSVLCKQISTVFDLKYGSCLIYKGAPPGKRISRNNGSKKYPVPRKRWNCH